MDAPANLYKYLPPERAPEVIGELLIRFSQVSVMNDIEEFKPPINGIATAAEFEQKIRERADALYPGLMSFIEAQGPSYMAKLRNQAEQNLQETISAIYRMNDKNLGFYPSRKNQPARICGIDNADQGRGFLVEFVPSHSWFRQKITDDDDLRQLRRVTYVADRTPAYLFTTSAQDYLYTKETKWKYEREWRMILNFSSAARNVGKDNTVSCDGEEVNTWRRPARSH